MKCRYLVIKLLITGAVLISMISLNAQSTPVTGKSTIAMKAGTAMMTPKKMYEWNQPYNGGGTLLVTVAVYDNNTYSTLIREKNTAGKINAYRYAARPGTNSAHAVYHESGVPLKGFPQSFLSRQDAGYHINIPKDIAFQIGNDFKQVLGDIKDMLKGPQGEIDNVRARILNGGDQFDKMSIGDGSDPSGGLGHQPKTLHGGKMGPTPFEIVSGKSGYAADDVTVSLTEHEDNTTTTTEITTHDDNSTDIKITLKTENDDGSTTTNVMYTNSDRSMGYSSTYDSPDGKKTVSDFRNLDNNGNGWAGHSVNFHNGLPPVVVQHPIKGGRDNPSETSPHHFTSDEINNLYQNHLGWLAEEYCFRKKKEPGDLLAITRQPVADGASGGTGSSGTKLGKDAVINPNENKYNNINPNAGKDSISVIKGTHVDPPNPRNKARAKG
jgi:hypothetical protein